MARLGIIEKELLRSGLQPDLAEDDTTLWVQALDVLFDNRGLIPFERKSLVEERLEGKIRAILNTDVGILYGADSGLWLKKKEGKSVQLLEEESENWSLVRWTDGAVVGSSTGKLRYLRYSDLSLTELDSPIENGCQALVVIRDAIFAFKGKDVFYSAIGNIYNWESSLTTGAGRAQLRGLEGDITAAVSFGNGAIVAGKHSLHSIEFVGGRLFYRFSKLSDEIGVASPHGLSSQGQVIYGLNQRGFWATDGTQTTFLAEGIAANLLKEMVNEEKVVIWNSDDSNSIFMFFSRGGNENSEGIYYDYQDKIWGQLSFGITAAYEQFFSDDSNNLLTLSGPVDERKQEINYKINVSYKVGFGVQSYGTGYFGGEFIPEELNIHNQLSTGVFVFPADLLEKTDFIIQSRFLDLQELSNQDVENQDKFIDFVEVEGERLDDVFIQFATRQRTGDTWEWSEKYEVSDKIIPRIANARQIAFRFTVSSVALPVWQISAIRFYGKLTGGRTP